MSTCRFPSPFRLRPPAALAASLSLLALPAGATLVSGELAFTAQGFPVGATVDPIVGRVRFSFDNAATFFNAGDGSVANGVTVEVSLESLNLPGNWTPVLTYIQDGVVGGSPVHDLMSIGHVLNGTQTVAGTDDWRIALNGISTAPSFREFTYTLAAEPSALFQTFTGSVTAVPEPAAVQMLAVGLGGLCGVFAWRGRHAGAAQTRADGTPSAPRPTACQ